MFLLNCLRWISFPDCRGLNASVDVKNGIISASFVWRIECPSKENVTEAKRILDALVCETITSTDTNIDYRFPYSENSRPFIPVLDLDIHSLDMKCFINIVSHVINGLTNCGITVEVFPYDLYDEEDYYHEYYGGCYNDDDLPF